MDTLERAFACNNNGVSLLNSGDSCGAMQEFQNGYAAMEKAVEILIDGDAHDATSTMRQLATTEKWTSCWYLEQRTGVKLEGLQHSLCFVYDRPLLIHPEDIGSGLLVPTAFLVFNLGLACHQRGRLTGNEESLRLASLYYDLTLRLIPRSGAGKGDDMLGVVKCLALNNQAHLFYESCDYKKSQGCLEYMDKLIIWTGCLDGSSASMFLSSSDCDDIKLNLFHLVPPTTASAA